MMVDLQKWFSVLVAILPQLTIALTTINAASVFTPNSSPNRVFNGIVKIVNFLSFNFGKSRNA